MARRTTIEIKMTGQRDAKALSPDTVGVNYLIEALGYVRDLVEAPETDVADPVVTIIHGSLALRTSLPKPAGDSLATVLRKVAETMIVEGLSKKSRRALEGLRSFSVQQGDTITIGTEQETFLVLDSESAFVVDNVVWVDAEVYLRGKVNNAGGVSKPNLHVETDDPRFGKLLISATKEQLSDDDKNRLYKPQTMHLSIRQNPLSGEYDLRSAKLLAFVETPPDVAATTYVDQLLDRVKGHFSNLGDKESWLAEIRGYEN